MTFNLVAHRSAMAGNIRPSLSLLSHRFQSTRPDATSFRESASEFFSSLRWKAATALTSSLSQPERQELLGRLQPPPITPPSSSSSIQPEAEDSVHVMQHSIAEAVAAVRVQEAQKHERKWHAERETILAQAEQAARARVENELVIQQRRLAFELWQRQVQEETLKNSGSSLDSQTAPAASLIETNGPTAVAAAPVNAPLDVDVHPLLGPCLADLGYKRVHLVSAQTLATIPVWKKQRIYRHNRAKEMAADKRKTLHLGVPGVIGLHEDVDGKLSILDGQHRVGMMTILQEKDNNSSMFDNVLVEVYPQTSDHGDSHAEDIFTEVNKAEPVRLVDMPGVAKAVERNTLTDGVNRLQEAFPDMFSASSRCRAPHLNNDNLRDALFKAEVLTRHAIKSAKALESWLLRENDKLAEKYKSGDVKGVSKAALNKAQASGFYLGLESSWLNN